MMKKILLSVFFALCFSFLFAQRNCFLFQDAKTLEPIIIENDSILYHTQSHHTETIKTQNFPGKLSDYNYRYIINGKNYFANWGAGCVLEYYNQNLNRIDKSFPHKNQKFASPFVYNNQFYLFGGYGLFTYKNVITYYSSEAKEWFEVPVNGIDFPAPRYKAYNILIGDNLYIFGGFGKEKNGVSKGMLDDDQVWYFNMVSRKWKKMGKLQIKYFNKEIKEENEIVFQFSIEDKLYIIEKNKAAIIDFKKNRVSYYDSPIYIYSDYIQYNPNTNEIEYLSGFETNDCVLKRVKINTIFKNPTEHGEIYNNDRNNYLLSIIIIISLLFLGLLSGYFIHKSRIKRRKTVEQNTDINVQKIIYSSDKQKLIFQDAEIIELDDFEKKVLIFLFENSSSFIPITIINDIISDEFKTTSIHTILRKREAIFDLLKFKLSRILGAESSDIILQQKNIQDKRIKEVQLNPQYFLYSK